MMSIAEVLLACADKTPATTAVVAGGVRLTYGELGERARRLAARLREHGVDRGTLVGLWFGEGDWVEYVTAYVATLLTGGAAVILPTDADHSALRRICGSMGVGRLVVARGSAPKLDVTLTFTDEASQVAYRPFEPVDPAAMGDVVFTSGSTGQPKGVAASHGVLAQLAHGYLARPRGAAVVGHGVSHSTAIGTRQLLLSTLARGATLVACVPFDSDEFLHLVRQEQIGTGVLPAGAGRAFARSLQQVRAVEIPSLKVLRFVSDQLSAELHVRIASALPDTRVLNVYGLTEGGDASLVVSTSDCHLGPGGYPATGTEVRIRAEDQSWASPGVEGLICFRSSLAPLSYVTDPRLAEYTWVDGWTVSSDLGTMDASGRVRFVGRGEGLARIGGRTVMLQRVKEVLESHPAVSAAAVVALEHVTLGQSLAAVVELDEDVESKDIRVFMRASLPDFCIPSPIIRVDQIPQTRTGKPLTSAIVALARSSLAGPSRPCETETERLVATICAEVLELGAELGPDDDFFRLGGDSLAAVEVVAALEGVLSRDLPMDLLLVIPNLGELARHLDGVEGAG